jgi:hypothetical protein
MGGRVKGKWLDKAAIGQALPSSHHQRFLKSLGEKMIQSCRVLMYNCNAQALQICDLNAQLLLILLQSFEYLGDIGLNIMHM